MSAHGVGGNSTYLPPQHFAMNNTIAQLNDDLAHAEATLRTLLESTRDWLDSDIKESGEDLVKGMQRRIIDRHPQLGWVVDPLEF